MNPLSASNVERAGDLLSSALFTQFLDERRYLKNVTPDTVEWYETAFKAFRRALNDDAPPIRLRVSFHESPFRPHNEVVKIHGGHL